MLPKWTEYNEDNCLFFLNTSKSEETMTLPLLEFEYQIGVFLAYETGEKNDNSTVKLGLTGNLCQATEYFDGTTCIGSTEVKNGNFSGHFEPGQTKFWTYMTEPGLAHFMLTMSGLAADEYQIKARYAGGTFATHDMMDTNGTLKVVSPRQGLWVFSVHLASGGHAGEAEVKLSSFKCGLNSAGDGCTLLVRDAADNMSLTMLGGEWMYLRFTVDDKHALLVSVTTNNGSNIPYLLAGNGQIPVITSTGEVVADIKNCNREYCSVVRSIVRNITKPALGAEEEYWYIGIYSHVPGNTTFGLWWNNSCVPNCDTDNHGECEESGRCQCEIDFEGIDCSVSKGLGPQYIVLIIIASLVVASAIIGFVAWAYMRRKRANYEIVS
jgi:hypothetical protein